MEVSGIKVLMVREKGSSGLLPFEVFNIGLKWT